MEGEHVLLSFKIGGVGMVGKLILDLECDDRSSVHRLERDEDLEELCEVPVDGYQVRLVGAAETHVWITKKPTKGRRERGEREQNKKKMPDSIHQNKKKIICRITSSKIKKNISKI